MKVIILAGGMGTRIQEETLLKPKPMIEIGGIPLLSHIMQIYGNYQFKEFILALGYKGEVIKNYFLNYFHLKNDLSVDLATGSISAHKEVEEDWTVHLIDTGLNTGTGGRAKKCMLYGKDERFMMTYGDGLADIDLKKLLQFHRSHGKLATVTAVRPPARFGGLRFDGERVTEFIEKPQIGEGWINGGFFVIEKGVMDYIQNDQIEFERDPLENLAKQGQLMAYKHEGFWHCMDTLRDLRFLENLWKTGEIPWNRKGV